MALMSHNTQPNRIMLTLGKPLTSEQAKTKIEKVMMTLCPEDSNTGHRKYLAGFIDCLGESNLVSEEIRQILYDEYGP
jgi:mannitol/fructose-specific phosphotransferase system IIA component (Ntr-type)